jgi:negative regulator of flagellin synthesis FlgM
VTTKISGYPNRPVQVGTDKSVTRLHDSAASPAGTAVSGSPIRITDQARQLAALEHAIQSMPAVNEARVAAIRQAIEQGTYQVEPERIADKLLQMERELAVVER